LQNHSVEEGNGLTEGLKAAMYVSGLTEDYKDLITKAHEHQKLFSIKDGPRSVGLTVKPTKIPTKNFPSCWNCGLNHKGGERACTRPCKICKDPNHTRYHCPKRKKKLQERKGNTASPVPPHVPPVRDHVRIVIPADTDSKANVVKDFRSFHRESLENSLPSTVDEDGPKMRRESPILDSGASGIYAGVMRNSDGTFRFPPHLSPGIPENVKRNSGNVSVGNGALLPIVASCKMWGLNDVQLVDGLTSHLVGINSLCKSANNNVVVFSAAKAWLFPLRDLVLPSTAKLIGELESDGLYHLTTDWNGLHSALIVEKVPSNVLYKIHQRCHFPYKRIVKAIRDGAIVCKEISDLSNGEIKTLIEEAPPCHSCALGKTTRKPVSRSYVRDDRALRPVQRILVDFSPPMPVAGDGGNSIVFYAIDEATGYGWCVPTSKRDLAPKCLLEILKPVVSYFERFGRTVQVDFVKGDDAAEFKSWDFRRAGSHVNVQTVKTGAPYYLHSIAIIDRYIRSVQDLVRTMMSQFKAPAKEWPWSYRHAAYLLNRIPSANKNVTPLELFFGPGHVPNYKSLRPFYCAVYVVRRHESVGKYENVAYYGRFLGYDSTTLGFKVRIYPHGKVVIRRDVYFLEDLETGKHIAAAEAARTHAPPVSSGGDCLSSSSDDDEDTEILESKSKAKDSKMSTRPKRYRRPVTRFSDGHQTQEQMWKMFAKISRRHADIPILGKVMLARAMAITKSKHSSIGPGWSLPNSYKDTSSAVDSAAWQEARANEFKNFHDMKVWQECISPDRKVRILPIAEVYDIKCGKDGKPIKRKYRICAKGFLQVKGVDFFSSYAPVIDADVLRMCYAVAAELQLEVEQFDFTAAFLNAPSDVEVYTELPPGYVPKMKAPKGKRILLRLLKAIYGMRQAARLFYKLLSADLIQLGFSKSRSSPCLCQKYYGSKKNIALLVIHVDDGSYFAKHREIILKDLETLSRKYKLSHEPLNWYVGLRTSRNEESIHVSCDAYIDHCAKRFGIVDKKPRTLPAVKAPESYDGNSVCKKRFQQVLGCLMYAANSCRPDICVITNMLASMLANPSEDHLEMAENTLSYLYKTKHLGLLFKRKGLEGRSDCAIIKQMKLTGYFDSDWAGDPDCRHSRSGNLLYFNDCLIHWKSKLQKLVSFSVFQSETISGCQLYKYTKFAKKIVADILGVKEGPRDILLMGDNEKSIECAMDNKCGKQSRHFEVRDYAMAEGVLKGEIKLRHVRSKENPADLFTKIACKTVFEHLVSKLASPPPSQ